MLYDIKDGDAITGLGILYYTKDIPTIVFRNVQISIDLVDESRYISINIVPYNNAIIIN